MRFTTIVTSLILVKIINLGHTTMKRTKLVSELTSNLQKELSANGHTKNMRIRVGWEDGAIRVFGNVRNFFQKQIVLALATKIRGNSQIEISDRLTVD